jgi:hypothetical protein
MGDGHYRKCCLGVAVNMKLRLVWYTDFCYSAMKLKKASKDFHL